ncbi:MAG: hypothetical protein EA397_17195 [Deltaproteobacteria bacterium]|nr:MAG: hypothetical protein EA397_17195 [Deltaproteobacteria bacterium]
MRQLPLVTVAFAGCFSGGLFEPYINADVTYRTLFVVETSDGPMVTFFTSTPRDHLFGVDARTGVRRFATVLSCATPKSRPEIYPPADGLAWVRCGLSEAYVIDLRTGDRVLSDDHIKSTNPDLVSGYQIRHRTISYDVDAPTRGLPITLHDGRNVWIDLEGKVQFEPVPTTPWKPGYFCWPEHKCSTTRKECLGFMKAPDGHGMVLSSNRIHGESQRAPTPIGAWPAGVLMPGLVGEPDSRCAYEHDDHYLLLHDSAAFDPKETLVSLYHRDGTSKWSVSYPSLGATDREQPRMAVQFGEEILVLIGNTRNRRFVRTALIHASTGEVTASHHVFGRAG